MNMKKCRNLLLAAAVLVAASSCSDKVQVKGTLAGAPDTQVVVKQLSGSTLVTLDTLKTDASGAYSCKIDVLKGQPQFVYLFKGDTKIASLLLQKGDKVKRRFRHPWEIFRRRFGGERKTASGRRGFRRVYGQVFR